MPGEPVPRHTLSLGVGVCVCLALAFGEGTGTFCGDGFPAATLSGRPHPTGLQPLLRPAPCRAPFGRGWKSEDGAKVWEVKKVFVFPWFLHKQPQSAHGPGAGRKTTPASVWGNPSLVPVALIYHPGQGDSVWPGGQGLRRHFSAQTGQVRHDFTPPGGEGPISKGKIHCCSERPAQTDWLVKGGEQRAGELPGRWVRGGGDWERPHGQHLFVELPERQRPDLVLPLDQLLL